MRSDANKSFDSTSMDGQLTLADLGIPLPTQSPNYQLNLGQITQLQHGAKGKTAYSAMVAANASRESVFRFAEMISNNHNIDGATDFYELSRKFGARFSFVEYFELKAQDGSIFVHSIGEMDIVLPVFTGANRDRFTIAHELGHYLMHTPKSQAYALRRDSTPVEWEANWFASGLMMPTKKFKEASERNDDTAWLSAVFGVSRQAAQVRLSIFRELGV